jgi:hypothetical protein
MRGVDLEIRLAERDRTCHPGDVVRGEVWVRVERPVACEKLLVRRLWRARGHGNPEEGRPAIQDLFHGEWSPGRIHRYPFEFTLPNGPATYHGRFFRLGWIIDASAEVPGAIDPRAEVELALEPGPAEGYYFGPAHAHEPVLAPAGEEDAPKAVIGGGILAIGLAGLFTWPMIGPAGWLEAAGAGATILLGGALAFPFVQRVLAQRRLGVPRVGIDVESAHRGGFVDVRVTLSPRVAVTLDALQVDLVAREEVVHGYDSDRAWSWKEVHRLPGSPDRFRRAIEAGETVTIEETIGIPPDAPLSFAGRENRLEWFIEVRVAVSGWSDWRRKFPVTVGPAATLAAAGIREACAEPALQARSW